mmetsp:Transcript_44749/g.91329  ORF Transcript_44749/g.91329 Transcript_44749/m.91329 type:complete len:465 (-) Transcript_44749:1015-2409(-)
MLGFEHDNQLFSVKEASEISTIIQTTLGPRSSLKMILDNQGRIIVTNDGNCILREIRANHPVSRSLIELSRTQDNEVGDGTTSVVILASEFLKISEILLQKGFHPNQIIGSFFQGLNDVISFLENKLSTSLNLENLEEIKKVVTTSICTKLVSRFSRLMCELSLKALKCSEFDQKLLEVRYSLKIEKIAGGLIDNSKVLSGLMIEKDVSHPKMRRNINNPTILLLDCPIEFKKGESIASFEITNKSQWEDILKMEEDYIIYTCAMIKFFQPDIVVTEKGVSDIALHYLYKSNISVLRRVKKSDNIRLAKVTGATIVSSIEDLEISDLGKADNFTVKKVGGGNYSFITGCTKFSPCTIFLSGPSKDILDEMERNLYDAIEVSRTILSNPKVLPGGGATELAIGNYLSGKSDILKNESYFIFKTMATVFEVIPRILIQNCGASPVSKISQLRSLHFQKGFFFRNRW